jgi:hypothetical protein
MWRMIIRINYWQILMVNQDDVFEVSIIECLDGNSEGDPGQVKVLAKVCKLAFIQK